MKNNNYKNRLKEFIVVSALLLALPLTVFGKPVLDEKTLSIGLRGTYSTPKDADEGQWYAGAQVRLHSSSSLALEGSIDYRSNSFGNLTTIKTYPVQVSLMAYLNHNDSWSPFLLGGGGWYYTKVNGPVSFEHTYSRFGVHAGAGLEIMLNKDISIDGSYRYVWIESVTSKDSNALDKKFEDSGSMVTFAINFFF